MMLYAKSDSEDATSVALSSPRSPKPAVYYVQSPSRDSHDEDKSSSTHATPNFNSPMESPSHPSYARHSRASCSSRVSGTYATTATSSTSGRKGGRSKRNDKEWRECNVIEEEEMYYYTNHDHEFHRRLQVLIGVLGFALLFSVFCLIIWGASRPFKPQITVKSLSVHSFYFGQGSDLTGVPTKMLTVNCSVMITVYNPATFFGIHINSMPVNLMYSEITVATGELKKYHQPRNSHRTVFVNLQGLKVPLYGAVASLATSDNNPGGIPLTLAFDVRSQGNVVGKLVKSKHTRHVSCSLTIDSRSTKAINFNKDSCAYK